MSMSILYKYKIYSFLKKNNLIEKLTDVEVIKQCKNMPVFKAGNNIIKCESKEFIHLYPNIKRIHTIFKNYIPDYKLAISPNIFYYKHIPGISLDDCMHKNVNCNTLISGISIGDFNYHDIKYNLNEKCIINNIIKFIKKNISIDEKHLDVNLFKGIRKCKPQWLRYYNNVIDANGCLKVGNNICKLTEDELLLVKKIKKICNFCILNQKKTNKKILMYNDLNAHNIIIDKKNNIHQIDLSDGFFFGNFNKYIYRYFYLLWLFGEEAVDKAIIDCKLNNNDIFVKELSFIYFHNFYLNLFRTNNSDRYMFNNVCNNIITSFEKRYPD